MFRNILSFWSNKDFLSDTLSEFSHMLKLAEEMYGMASAEILTPTKGNAVRDKIYKMDREVNQIEQSIRRRIVSHMAVKPGGDTNLCLILMSVSKDAERVGDYIKNLWELTKFVPRPLDENLYKKVIDNLVERVAADFSITQKAFVDSDEKLAREVITSKQEIGPRCDKILQEVIASDLSAANAVFLAILARTLKRIVAHLTNISSAVVMSVPDLDYYDEKRLEDDK